MGCLKKAPETDLVYHKTCHKRSAVGAFYVLSDQVKQNPPFLIAGLLRNSLTVVMLALILLEHLVMKKD